MATLTENTPARLREAKIAFAQAHGTYRSVVPADPTDAANELAEAVGHDVIMRIASGGTSWFVVGELRRSMFAPDTFAVEGFAFTVEQVQSFDVTLD